jgi:hypothetical protein
MRFMGVSARGRKESVGGYFDAGDERILFQQAIERLHFGLFGLDLSFARDPQASARANIASVFSIIYIMR